MIISKIVTTMPYQWKNTDPANTTLELWPYRSLSIRGFVIFISITAILISLPLLAILGTMALWGILPFIIVVFVGIWIAFMRSYKDAQIIEVLTINPDQSYLIRKQAKGALIQEWQANTYWVQSFIYPKEGPVPDYLTLRGNNREVEIGAFLTQPERQKLHYEICTALAKAQIQIT